jgi:GMP synthase-like glutamine amidotransferase
VTRAFVVEHLKERGSGAFDEWLPAAGLDLAVHWVPADGPPPTAFPDGYDALVVMGGAMGVPDATTTHTWLNDDFALLRDAVGRGVPVLGVCLGAQLLAAACGGLVERGRTGPEAGVRRVHLTPAAEADPLLYGLPPIVEAVQWHWDEIVTLPPGSAHLAASPQYPHQAFRVGANAWGVQFHPEAEPAMTAGWARDDERALAEAGEDAGALAAEAAARWPDLERTWRPVAERFASFVGG